MLGGALTAVAIIAASCAGDDDAADTATSTRGTPSITPTSTVADTAATVPATSVTAAPIADSTTAPTTALTTAPPPAGTTGTSGTTPPLEEGATATTTPAPQAPVGSIALRATEIARLEQPTAFATHPVLGINAIAEKAGRVVHLSDTGDATVVLDIRDRVGSRGGEQGLLGLAYSPDGDHLYVDYTNRDGNTRVTEFSLGADAVPDPGSERLVLAVDQPFPNHNGGQVAFGPDGYLYVGLGDGGSQGDPQGNGQRPDRLLAKILRIDPRPSADGSAPYTIPPDNPFASGRTPDGAAAAPEVWAYGLRNPWRFSFDRATGDLYIADVGGGLYEEVDWQAGGGGGGQNYGWVDVEGPRETRSGAAAGTVLPIAFHHHDDGWCSITGGFVYRGTAIAGLAGTYVYGDFCRDQLTGFRIGPTGAVTEGPVDLGVGINNLSSLGEDLDGELYLLSLRGAVYRLGAT
jgi:glucose/arabinose dehydrogenase